MERNRIGKNMQCPSCEAKVWYDPKKDMYECTNKYCWRHGNPVKLTRSKDESRVTLDS
jgi:hypothetical protein